MSLDSIIRNAVAVMSSQMQSVKSPVQHVIWTGQDGMGAKTTTTVTRHPVISYKRHQRRLLDGRIVEVTSTLTFLEPIPPNGAAGRTEPVDTKDKFVLPDGSGGPIVDVIGLHDKTQGRPFYTKVFLGVRG